MVDGKNIVWDLPSVLAEQKKLYGDSQTVGDLKRSTFMLKYDA